MDRLQKLVSSVVTHLYVRAGLCCCLLAVSGYLLFDTLFNSTGGWIAAVVSLGVGCWLTTVFASKKPQAVRLVHQCVDGIEYSLNLLDKQTVNTAERLQLERVAEAADSLSFPYIRIYRNTWPYIALFVVVILLKFSWTFLQSSTVSAEGKIVSKASVKTKTEERPSYINAEVTIKPPPYSRLPEVSVTDLNITVLIGSHLTWEVRFKNGADLRLFMANDKGQEVAFKKHGEIFEFSDRLTGSGLYAIRGYWQDSVVYQSEFYRLSAVADQPPVIEPKSKDLYTYHRFGDSNQLKVAARMADDFLVKQAFIVATIARGSGENVKFREVRLRIAEANFQEANLTRIIDLKPMDFAPGDELYYYWAAVDNKEPAPNFSRSDTYFVVYKDTAAVNEAELATMAANIMPEYFRSQRQIIIDTEKLVAKRKKLAVKLFQSASNEIGFDQKALRLRYGQYLGEEFETSIGGGVPVEDHDDHSGKNMLDAFSHKSDAEGEAAESRAAEPERHDHGHAAAAMEQDPLAALMEQYVHAHDDAEANTFYEESTRSLLKMALEQMWQSELHLRLYEPEKALPYEHKALEFLKSAQHKARTFAKKSGYDPPPIKEKEKRLTGELKDISTQLKSNRNYKDLRVDQVAGSLLGLLGYNGLDKTKHAERLRLALLLFGMLEDRKTFQLQPDWAMMASLRKLLDGRQLAARELTALQTSLFQLAKPTETDHSGHGADTALGKAFWKHMK